MLCGCSPHSKHRSDPDRESAETRLANCDILLSYARAISLSSYKTIQNIERPICCLAEAETWELNYAERETNELIEAGAIDCIIVPFTEPTRSPRPRRSQRPAQREYGRRNSRAGSCG